MSLKDQRSGEVEFHSSPLKSGFSAMGVQGISVEEDVAALSKIIDKAGITNSYCSSIQNTSD